MNKELKDGSTVKAHAAVVRLGNCPSTFWQSINATDNNTVILPDSTKEEVSWNSIIIALQIIEKLFQFQVSFALKSFYLERNSTLLDNILGISLMTKSNKPQLSSSFEPTPPARNEIKPKMLIPKSFRSVYSSRITCDICGLSVSKRLTYSVPIVMFPCREIST